MSTPLFSSQQPPKSLCILRLSAIGDVTHALAVVQEIARYYPECKITWIVGKIEYALLAGLTQMPQVQFVVFDKKAGWRGVLKLWKQLKNQRFDALLNMQTAVRSSLISLGIKAKYKIGFGEKRRREGQGLFVNQYVEDPENPHVLDGFMAFAHKIGVAKFEPSWQLVIPETAKSAVEKWQVSDRVNLMISPCSSKVEKDWLAERYAEVASYALQHNINVILSGSPAPREMEMCEKITALCREKSGLSPRNACGKTSLTELTALISGADLLLAPDSGPAHIATMVGTPVIGLYAYHNPKRTAPYHNLSNVISVYEQNVQKEYHRASSKLPWATKLKGKNLMAEIQVEDVLNKMRELGFIQ
ncbi:glycosyl transferase [Pasteurellaceae bacterium Pebbles2]|nr:glycosyl transferase [Pasteurellaceae bacterium Pebbles2]